MKVCLVTAATAAEFEDPEELESECVEDSAQRPQLGILSLAAVLGQSGYPLSLINLNRKFLEYKQGVHIGDFASFAVQSVLDQEADLYGFGTISSSYPLTIRIAEAVKKEQPDSIVLLGGPQASIVDLPSLAAFPFIDFILRGESELTLPVFLEELQGQHRFESVPSLSYRTGSKPWRNESAPVILDLDNLLSPAYHLTGELRGASEAALELGRGCPFSCTFCSTNDFFRRKFRLRSPERVLQDMRAIHAEYGIAHFDLVHDMFTVDRRRVVAFCEAMLASKTGFTWACSARTDCIDEELMELMYDAGCRGIFFGVETGSRRMQRVIDKDLDIERAKQVVNYAERLGISNTVSLITGFPEETWEDLRQTVKMFVHASRCPQSNPQLNLLAPLAGTPIFEEHKHELVLEELCSDVSHQGRAQHPLDRRLIKEYPDIFPNFYLVPTPNLDRAMLIELREFCLAMKSRFRWLFVAIDKNEGGALGLYADWRKRRLEIHPELNGSELRQYYRTALFRGDFIQFLAAHPITHIPAVAALLEYEKTLHSSNPKATSFAEQPLKLEEELWWSDVPAKKGRTRVLNLSFDIQQVIDALKQGQPDEWRPGRYFYVLREVSRSTDRLDRISDWMAAVLTACDSRNDIQNICDQLAVSIPEVESQLRPYVCLRLLRAAQGEGFIHMYRPTETLQSEGLSASA